MLCGGTTVKSFLFNQQRCPRRMAALGRGSSEKFLQEAKSCPLQSGTGARRPSKDEASLLA
jgi:hypothetical protein